MAQKAETALLVPISSPIKDPEKIEDIKQFLRQVWSVESLIPNPVPLPCSLSREDLETLKEKKDAYVVAEKSDGCRYSLVLHTYRNGNPYAVLINRNLEMYEVKVVAKEDIFRGSVFEGELIWEKYSRIHSPRQEFLVFECVYYMGKDVGRKNLVDRLQIINDLFFLNENDMDYNPEDWVQECIQYAKENKIVCKGNIYNLRFRPKRCHMLNSIEMLFRTMKSLKHRSDGLIFTPIYERVRRGRHKTMYKWKSEHTIDLLFHAVYEDSERTFYITPYTLLDEVLVPCENNLYSQTSGNPVVLSINHNDFLISLLAHLEQKNIKEHSFVVECSMEKLSQDEWRCTPIILRRDKNVPNASTTIELTLTHAEENITLQEIYNAFIT